jgi:hypothetical protein
MMKQNRPFMPGYGISTKRKGLLEWEVVEKGMLAARNYWLATSRTDGRPHSTPVWGLWHSSVFYFGMDKKSQKAENIANNSAIVVHLESGDEVVILEGVAEQIKDKNLLQQLDELYRKKYDVPLLGEAPIFALEAEKIFAWHESDFPNTATRWQLDEG